MPANLLLAPVNSDLSARRGSLRLMLWSGRQFAARISCCWTLRRVNQTHTKSVSDDSQKFRCLVVSKTAEGAFTRTIENRGVADLPDGDVQIRAQWSSLNFKDALSATGNPGVSKIFPHVPGIDVAGVVEESRSEKFQVGQDVLVTGFDLGTSRWGGWAELVRVPADWVVPLPAGLTARQAMALGTAGFTAAQCVDALLRHDVRPGSGEILVTGASGGVGSLSVAILAQLGFNVVAVSGKPEWRERLLAIGAGQVIGRDEVIDAGLRPLLSARWAGSIDTVGGTTLATTLRATRPHGCVAACGLVGGSQVPLTVFPFILRGVTLVGIDSAWCSAATRASMWSHLATDWKPRALEHLVREVDLETLEPEITSILAGRQTGRVVVRLSSG